MMFANIILPPEVSVGAREECSFGSHNAYFRSGCNWRNHFSLGLRLLLSLVYLPSVLVYLLGRDRYIVLNVRPSINYFVKIEKKKS